VQHHRSFYAGWRNPLENTTLSRRTPKADFHGAMDFICLRCPIPNHPMTNPKQIVAVAAPPGFSDFLISDMTYL
jgi:hypothetical protein